MSDDTKHSPSAEPTQVIPPSASETIETPGKKAIIEIGGPKGPEPTRYGDWEQNGRCSDF